MFDISMDLHQFYNVTYEYRSLAKYYILFKKNKGM